MTTLREKLGRSDSIPCEDLEKQYALQSDRRAFFESISLTPGSVVLL